MKLGIIASACAIALGLSTFAYGDDCWFDNNRVGIQAAMSTGGALSIGIVDFTDMTEIGFNASGIINNANRQTKLFIPDVFAGLRAPICRCTTFAYGFDVASAVGQESGSRIQSDVQVGPYVSLEQNLTSNLLLVGWIDPYSYEYKKKAHGDGVSTHRIFASGGIGLNYFF